MKTVINNEMNFSKTNRFDASKKPGLGCFKIVK